jgi:hypothetical protein
MYTCKPLSLLDKLHYSGSDTGTLDINLINIHTSASVVGGSSVLINYISFIISKCVFLKQQAYTGYHIENLFLSYLNIALP